MKHRPPPLFRLVVVAGLQTRAFNRTFCPACAWASLMEKLTLRPVSSQTETSDHDPVQTVANVRSDHVPSPQLD